MKRDFSKIRPYGDHLDDGRMQLSFTLPVPASPEAKEGARQYCERLGLKQVQVVSMQSMGEDFSFFVVYAHATPTIDLTRIHLPRLEFPIIPFDELVRVAQEKIGRKIVVVGATTGSDAHTVGIDAILSMKGIAGDKGLEYYPCFQVINLRAQVDNHHLVEKAAAVHADAILVSKLVTQQDQHLKDLQELGRMLKGEHHLPAHLLKIVGGPRIDHATAKKIGYDAGFGPGTKPSEVANYIVHELVRRITGEKTKDRMESKPPQEAPARRRSLFGWLGGRREDS